MSIRSNIEKLLNTIPASIQLVAISKTQPISAVQEAFEAGQIHFGENRVQEMKQKQELLPPAILWHQVGTLQRNKVKYIAPFVHLVHSVDDLRLLEEINRQAEKNGRVQDVLLQMHIAQEETKFGMNETELRTMLESPLTGTLKNVCIRGLMGMATNTPDRKQVAQEFRSLRKLYDGMKAEFSGHPLLNIDTLSMGMSSDYLVAIEEGSTMIRVGSALFGSRL